MTSISDYEIFARVARTGNMSAAGREMKLSPAVVSKRISLLEERLGARLFQRTTRQLTLTETGEGFFRRVIDILNLVEEAEDFVNRRNSTPKGTLKIAAPTAFARMHIAPHIARFNKAYPEIELVFHIDDELVDIIRDGYDVAIRTGELRDSTMVAKKLAPDHRVICAAPSYLKANGRPKTLRDLDRHNCLSCGAQENWRLNGPNGRTTFKPRGSLRSNSGDFVRALLLEGYGIALAPIWCIGPEIKSGKLEIVLPEYTGDPSSAIYALYPSREFMPAKLSCFIEFLSDLYGSKPYWEVDLKVA